MTNSTSPLPKIRAVDARPFTRNGQLFIAIRDPLRLADKTIFIPQFFAPVLALCDGTRDARSLSAALAVRVGLRVSPDEIEEFLNTLDETFLLDNERFAEAYEQALADYRDASFREPVLAGGSYPVEPDELRGFLASLLESIKIDLTIGKGRGLISPHIDYARGGAVYAQVWGSAQEFIRAADLAVIIGTDHFGQEGRITLTRQNYATPFGVLPTDQDIIHALGKAIGEEIAFAGELYHRGEHSIEMAATWLHYIRDGQPCELVPILCDSFKGFFGSMPDPDHDPELERFILTLRSAIANHQAIVVAAGDLSHVGPAFGGHPLDLVGRSRLQTADDDLIERICAGDAQGFYELIRGVEDAYNVCGITPIYLTMRLLSPVQGKLVAYDRCPADEQGTSFVSICGVVFE